MILDAGIEKPQGAENSAEKNTAPLSLTLLRISENASTRSPVLSAKFSGSRAKGFASLVARANHDDAWAWIYEQAHSIIVVLKGTPGGCTESTREGKK